jgi:hypothetical protein
MQKSDTTTILRMRLRPGEFQVPIRAACVCAPLWLLQGSPSRKAPCTSRSKTAWGRAAGSAMTACAVLDEQHAIEIGHKEADGTQFRRFMESLGLDKGRSGGPIDDRSTVRQYGCRSGRSGAG